MSFANEIKNVAKSDTAVGALYVGFLGAVLGDLLPTPADAIYFYAERNLRDQWKRGEITPTQYWKKEAIYYYTLNPAWWLIVLGVTIAIKGDVKRKLTVASGIIGAGAVIGVLMKNVKKDKMELAQEANDKAELLKYKG